MKSRASNSAVPREFEHLVKRAVQELRTDYEHANDGDAFAHWSMMQLFSELDPDSAEKLVYVGLAPGKDGGLDAYRDYEGTFYLFQAKMASRPKRFGPKPVRELFTAFDLLRDPMRAGQLKRELGEVALQMKESLDSGCNVQFCFVLFGTFNGNARRELVALLKAKKLKNASYDVYDLHRLYEMSGWTASEPVEELTLPIVDGEYFTTHQAGMKALVANVRLLDLGKALRTVVPQIFDANYRNPLGPTKVNKAIKETLQSKSCNEFWHYNNGLTVLCEKVRKDTSKPLLVVKKPSIVNGCQTSYTIKENLSQIASKQASVLMRFIELPGRNVGGKARDRAVNIAKYTNSQSPVRASDFRSNDPVHSTLHQRFDMLVEPWFYEYKRGQWRVLGKKQRKRRYADRMLDKLELAQAWRAFDGYPHEAINVESLFENDSLYKAVFDEKRSAIEFLISYLLLEQVEKEMRKATKAAMSLSDKDESSRLRKDRFERLSRAKKLVNLQLVALMGHMIKDRYGGYDEGVATKILPLISNEQFVDQMYGQFETIIFDYMEAIGDSLHADLRKPQALAKLIERLEKHFALPAYKTLIDQSLPSEAT